MAENFEISNSQDKKRNYVQAGITLCGILSIGISLFAVIKALYFYMTFSMMISINLDFFRIRNLSLIQDFISFAALAIAALGLLLRKTWGWWLLTICYAYAVLGNVYTLALPIISDYEIPYNLSFIIMTVVPKIIIIIICMAFLIYLLVRSVREALGISKPLFKVVIMLVGAGIFLEIAHSMLTLVIFKT